MQVVTKQRELFGALSVLRQNYTPLNGGDHMDNFENKLIFVPYVQEHVHVSRIIASWFNGLWSEKTEIKRIPNRFFRDWLWMLGISKSDILYIENYVRNGKCELENHIENLLESI
jgi:hypothetical protein